jgi:hypothetical protein
MRAHSPPALQAWSQANGTLSARLQNDPLDLVERYLIVAAIVELCHARSLVRRHLLGVFEEAAVQQIDGDAGPAVRDGRFDARDLVFPERLGSTTILGTATSSSTLSNCSTRDAGWNGHTRRTG